MLQDGRLATFAKEELKGRQATSQSIPPILWHDFVDKSKAGTMHHGSASTCRFGAGERIRLACWTANPKSAASLHQASITAEALVEQLGSWSYQSQKATTSIGVKGLVAQLQACLRAFQAVSQANELLSISTFEGNEAKVRMLLDVLLVHLCGKLRLRISPEHSLPDSSPFVGKADYLLLEEDLPVAVIEAKRCLGPAGQHQAARHALFVAAMAQCCAILTGFQSAHPVAPLFGIVTDARGWLLVQLTGDKQPVLRLWPGGQAILEATSAAELAHLLSCLAQLLKKSPDSCRPRCWLVELCSC